MTDSIRIPVRYGIDNTTHATITPDLAAQIVTMGNRHLQDTDPWDGQTPTHAVPVPNGSTALPPEWSAPIESIGIFRDSVGVATCSVGLAPLQTSARKHADKPAPSGPCDLDESSNRVCEQGTHGCTVTHQPAGDDAAVERKRYAKIATDVLRNANRIETTMFTGSIGLENHHMLTREEEIALHVCAEIATKHDEELADLRAKLAEAEAYRQEGHEKVIMERDRLAARVAELERQIVGEVGDVDTKRVERDKALADLANQKLCYEAEIEAKVEAVDSFQEQAHQLMAERNRAREDLAAMTERAERAEKETTEAIRQKDICRIDAIKLRDMLEASKNGHWYGRMITAETQAVDLKQERDAARAEAEKYKAETERHIRLLSECAKERDALKARKVDLSGADTCDCGGIHKATVIELVSAAGVGVE